MMTADTEDAECLDLVRFRVAEYIYVCHKSTLLKFPNSRLAQLIKPENDKRKSGQDHIVVDGDGRIFGIILGLMRNSSEQYWKDLSESETDDLIQGLESLHLDDLKKSVEAANDKLPGGSAPMAKLIDARRCHLPFDRNTIVIQSKSIAGFDMGWQNIFKQLCALGKFDICINGFDYTRRYVLFGRRLEEFRFHLPAASSNQMNDSSSLDRRPKLFADSRPSRFQWEFYLRKKYVEGSKANLLRFLIAAEMYLKATTAEDLLAIEKRLPRVHFRRHPKPNASSSAAKTVQC